MKSYKIFILFLLVSMSIFADKPATPPGQEKKVPVVTTKNDVIKGTAIPYEMTITSGNGGGNEIVKGWVDYLVYKSDTREIQIVLECKNSGEKDVKELYEKIAENEPVTTFENEVKIGRYYTLSQDGNIWTLTYTSNLKAEPGDEVEISFYIGKGGLNGNGNLITVKYRVPYSPFDIEVKTYEELYQKEKSNSIKDGYKFTKGGLGSNNLNPAIYVVVPENKDSDKKGQRIKKIKIEKLNADGSLIAEKTLDLSGKTGDVGISFNFSREGANRVRITPVNEYGMEGKSEELKFVVDTRVNTSYLDNEIIGSLNGEDVEVDLSKIEELSGVEGYEYMFTVEGKKSEKIIKRDLEGKSFTAPAEGSIDGIITIDTSGFTGGSKGTLLFTVYDKLGNKKTYEKTYFIPAKPTGIIAKVSGEMKQRNSRIKIVTEGSEDNFGVDSNIDRSSE
ncbi:MULTISPECIES: hypothetical protein [Psychrilyobacter]|uniref:Uncharacterized protein n=1 Tax=Psychrilyobacter piezotolerans TaxID=2293438 RepID=A0ABX9KEW2_9FUSO|nr:MULTISPECIES: hypothetical protein [Psychrilyobacter]MCS5421543.1 hypothetical protein [Psychrilyobacter sp. S5]NDI78666.1 hypothetical protein [Psychrilyobacter piezotolerans]RDE60018.1 hypothetical protein DV867_11780 [Psychrilyobacter sp. S5]REI40245.1 hypothetical protein DYH56_11780 [Psychrilyobacter piezotolerans]